MRASKLRPEQAEWLSLRRSRKKKENRSRHGHPTRGWIKTPTMADFPSDLRYTKEHEWARLEDGKVRVGITQHAVDQLGDITLVNIDVRPGSTVEAGKPFGTVESVKAVSDLFSPVSGKVVEVNTALNDHPELINEDPYTKGWMVLIEADPQAMAGLMNSQEYSAYVASL